MRHYPNILSSFVITLRRPPPHRHTPPLNTSHSPPLHTSSAKQHGGGGCAGWCKERQWRWHHISSRKVCFVEKDESFEHFDWSNGAMGTERATSLNKPCHTAPTHVHPSVYEVTQVQIRTWHCPTVSSDLVGKAVPEFAAVLALQASPTPCGLMHWYHHRTMSLEHCADNSLDILPQKTKFILAQNAFHWPRGLCDISAQNWCLASSFSLLLSDPVYWHSHFEIINLPHLPRNIWDGF